MGATKNLMMLMQEQEVSTNNFLPTKKELELSSKTFAKNLIDSGEIDKYEAFAQAVRMSKALEVITDEIKTALPREKHTFFGIELTPVSGRSMIQFQEDEYWQDLKNKLTQREELLKTALKSDSPIYDSEGVEVPKVSVKYASDSITVKY
jgi:type III secretory pathway component EscV